MSLVLRESCAVNEGRYESFMVRVWSQDARIVRGEVLHVRSGESTRFAEIRALVDFLERQVGAHCESRPAAPEPDDARELD